VAVSRRHADLRPYLRLGLVAFGGVAAVGLLATAWLTAAVARTIIVPPRKRQQDVVIVGVDETEGSVELRRSADTVISGRYSLWFSNDRGHARIGDILSETDETVTRLLVDVSHGDLRLARSGRISGWWYLTPDDLGVGYENVDIDTELGPAPAWLIPAHDDRRIEDTDRWVIQVHGRAVRRPEGLRAVPVFRDAGYHSLLISYRNDGDAPSSADGRYSLGDTEWRDVESAMQYALERGAKHIVLMGWSMGGATVLQAVTRSQLASLVRGVVLESPVIDWVITLEAIAGEVGLPVPVSRTVFRAIGAPWGRILTGQRDPIDLARLNFVRRADELDLPILILHSDDDGFVPSTGSRALAEARPDIVQLEAFTVARHTKLWNYDEERFVRTIRKWLGRPELTA
jgi:uncharacterized protein